MTTPKFSVISVARDEATTIPRLLSSLSEFLARGGEFVVVDTGSSDGTAHVAREGGAKVIEAGDRFRHVCNEETARSINEKFVVQPDGQIIKAGDAFFAFDQARNFAMEQSSNDLICTPDADEVWTTLNIDRINELIEQGYEKFLVDYVFAHHSDGTPTIAFCADTRFYDRRRIKWKGIVHETMQHDGDLKIIRLPRDVAYLEHFQNKDTDRSKYLAGLAWACASEPDNDRNSHYFARELMYKGMYYSAIKEFKRHIDMNGWVDERGQSMIYLGHCYDHIGDAESALEWWWKSLSVGSGRREPFLNMAYYWKKKDKYALVAAYAAAALEIKNNGFYANRVSAYTDEPHALMYWAKGWQGDIPAARQHLLKCLEFHPTHPEFLLDMQYYFTKEEQEEARGRARGDYTNEIPGWMKNGELNRLHDMAKDMASIVEVGSWKGRSTHALLSACKGTVFAIDHFQGSIGEEEAHAEAKTGDIYAEFMKNVGMFPNLQVVKAASLVAAQQIADKSVDMVFLDGGHTYEEVKADIAAWEPKVTKIICGHDYSWPDVKRAVDERLGAVEVYQSLWIKRI